jgi:thiamine biosynthesis protein ThiI
MKTVSLMSSGIDSPVATFLISKKTKDIILLHVDTEPYTDQREKQIFLKLAQQLKKITKQHIKTYIIPHGNNLKIFQQNCDKKYTCIFCKRMMLRYAEKIAQKEQADTIIMGDSLGQVASQTLQNIQTIERAINMPVLRPLIGMDKQEIINIAKEIGTYDISIQKKDPCSAVPKKPATMAKLKKITDEENKINISELVKTAVENAEVITI